MSALNNPKAPHNQVFQITGNKTSKLSWWNPAAPHYWRGKKK
jgi:hypothetical protein